jgi:hypothetical protein
VTVHVFTGPTLDADLVRRRLGATVWGPAAFGDVCRVTQTRPTAIAIIDGYFERVPAVWHKEILWAMSEGVHVFGCSSMGALRAAELADYGMEGIGRIFEAYRGGELEDDDEVAVVHGLAADGYAPLSDAMVNIRATLLAASRAGIVDPATADALQRMAKTRFYADRTYASLMLDATSAGIARNEIGALREWLPTGRIDQKRLDALQLVRHLSEWLATAPKPKKVNYRFERTDAWHEASRIARTQNSSSESTYEVSDDFVVEEVKIAGIYSTAMAAAAARGAAIEMACQAGIRPDAVALRAAAEALWRAQGLHSNEEYQHWCSEQGLDETKLGRFLEDQARLSWALPLTESVARRHLAAHLRATGEYGPFRSKAESKERCLVEHGTSNPSLADVDMTEPELWTWYFSLLQRTIPDDLDAFARSAGFRGKDELRMALVREVLCTRMRERDPSRPLARLRS